MLAIIPGSVAFSRGRWRGSDLASHAGRPLGHGFDQPRRMHDGRTDLPGNGHSVEHAIRHCVPAGHAYGLVTRDAAVRLGKARATAFGLFLLAPSTSVALAGLGPTHLRASVTRPGLGNFGRRHEHRCRPPRRLRAPDRKGAIVSCSARWQRSSCFAAAFLSASGRSFRDGGHSRAARQRPFGQGQAVHRESTNDQKI